jgi:flagellin-like hook-associated protein FlgL
MAELTEYPDISHFQGNISLAGARIVAAKATQGTGFTDPSYAANKAKAAAAGALFIAYHWLDDSDAAAQARHAFSVVGPGVPLMIDDEEGKLSISHTLAFVNAYRALGGLVKLEYAPRSVWSASGQPDLRPLTDAGLFIVSANYPAAGYSDNGPGWQPYGGVTPTIWQFTDRHPFNGQNVDFNAFRGTVDQLRSLLLSGGGTSVSTGSDVWGFVITSPSLGMSDAASEYLKFAVSASRTADAILATVKANEAADATRDAAVLAAIKALTQSGTSVDTAAVITAILGVRDEARTQFTQLHTELAAAQARAAAAEAQVTQLRTQLAAATRAEADALTVPPPTA